MSHFLFLCLFSLYNHRRDRSTFTTWQLSLAVTSFAPTSSATMGRRKWSFSNFRKPHHQLKCFMNSIKAHFGGRKQSSWLLCLNMPGTGLTLLEDAVNFQNTLRENSTWFQFLYKLYMLTDETRFIALHKFTSCVIQLLQRENLIQGVKQHF